MSHHTKDLSCPLCEEKLLQLHPELVTWWRWIKIRYPDEHLSWTFRGKEDQDRFYHEGKTRAMWPNSKHNAMSDGKPCSLAWDSFRIRPDGVPEWREERYRKMARELEAEHAPIDWAGDWQNFKEFDHMQLKPKKPGPAS